MGQHTNPSAHPSSLGELLLWVYQDLSQGNLNHLMVEGVPTPDQLAEGQVIVCKSPARLYVRFDDKIYYVGLTLVTTTAGFRDLLSLTGVFPG